MHTNPSVLAVTRRTLDGKAITSAVTTVQSSKTKTAAGQDVIGSATERLIDELVGWALLLVFKGPTFGAHITPPPTKQ